MSAPSGGPLDQEPSVQIRRSITGSNPADYGGVSGAGGGPLPPPDPAEPSINSISGSSNLGPDAGSSNGGTSRNPFNIFRRRQKPDKAPLLNEDRDELMRSLSGGGSSVHLPMGNEQNNQRRDGLSTFSGVFAPVCLSMFSVLLFLRTGYVIGFAGIGVTIALLCLAYGIIILTVLSLCAISTNGAIEGGGVYYMISRALGPEFGGSIGVLFFLANVFANALYISGFVEVLMANWGGDDGVLKDTRLFRFLYGVCVSLVILLICLVGASLFAKTSLLILFVVAISYSSFVVSLYQGPANITIPASNELIRQVTYKDENGTHHTFDNGTVTRMYTGLSEKTFEGNLGYNMSGAKDYTTGNNVTFALIFGVVFSGVTGIMAGANMSGELKQPNVSIPKGTLQAVIFTFFVYVVTTFLIGLSCSRELLRNDYTVLQDINVWSYFIVIGIMCTTLFAGLSNLIGASRVLVRVAEDKLFGTFLNPLMITIRGNNPIVAVFLSWFLSLCVLSIGALNKIAQITSIFFLLSYIGVNLACLALDLASAPNFRPQFKWFSSTTAFLGALGCMIMMFVVDAVMSAIAIIVLMALFLVLHYKAPIASWGSISQALIFHQVRKYLLLLDSRKDHVKYWRPQMLLLVNSPTTACPLIDFVNDLKKSGLYVIGHVRKGRLDDFKMDPMQQEMPYWLSLIDFLSVKAFVELTIADSVRDGLQQLMRISGLGAMKPNTVILGFHDESRPENALVGGRMLKSLKYAKLDRAEVVEYFTNQMEEENGQDGRVSPAEFVYMINDVLKLNKNVCIARHFHKLDKELIFKVASRKFVDVWPINLERPHSNGQGGWDNSCLFLLQLACILNMVNGWKNKTTLRVFLTVTSLQDMKRREKQLRSMLNELRITAKSVVLPWDHVICHLPAQASENPNFGAADFPSQYVKAMNELIRQNSGETSVVLMNMPAPPGGLDENRATAYHAALRDITENLPPTLMVHGLSSVISTAL